MLLMVINLNRCQNIINGLQTQDKYHDQPFQQFLDSYANHRGVTRVISGGNFAKNRKKSQFYLMLLIVINHNRCQNIINGLQTQDKDHDQPIQQFFISYTNYRGVTRVISGGNFFQNRKKTQFYLMLLIVIDLNRCQNTVN